MKIIGVTGPSGAGKSFFCSFLTAAGCAVLDCDEIYHKMTDVPSDCTRELAADPDFGPAVLKSDGSLDRRAMAALVFATGNEDRLARLNEITHRHVTAELVSTIEALKSSPRPPKAVIIDAPLLYQAGIEKICDRTCALLAGRQLRLERLRVRDGLDDTRLEARLSAAPDDAYYSSRADVTVINEGDGEKLRKAAEELLSETLK